MPDHTHLPVLPELSVPDDGDLMQVGDLARESGKTVRAIHLYEELALLRPARRSKGRYRLYGRDALHRIRWISKLQEIGFSLPEIQAVVKELPTETAQVATGRMRELYRRKLDETRAQMARLEGLAHELEASLAYLETCGDVCEPTRIVAQCTSCDLHPQKIACIEGHVPELVLGFRAQAKAP